MWVDNFKLALAVLEYNKSIQEYKNKSFFKKLTSKKPIAPSIKTWEELSSDYVKELKDVIQYELITIPEQIKICWQKSPNNLDQKAYPIIEFWTYRQGCYFVTRQAFQPGGTIEEWGCPYPYSECGITGRSDSEEDAKAYIIFDKIINKIKKDLYEI